MSRASANIIGPRGGAMSTAPRIFSRASHGPDEIDEYASMVELQVGQFVGEIGEVVADTSLQILADVMVDCGQDAAAALVDVRELKRSHLGQGVPLLEEPVVHTQHFELRGIIEESRLYAVQARFSQPVCVLATHGPVCVADHGLGVTAAIKIA